MAIQADFLTYTDCYFKAYPVTLQEYIEDEYTPKVFICYMQYGVFTDSTKTSMINGGSAAFEIYIDPDLPVYEQVYAHMKTLFPVYTDV